MLKFFVCLALLSVFSMNVYCADSEEKLLRLSQSKEWLRLLHYGYRISGEQKSLVDNPNFFLSPDGNTNPLAELKATIHAFEVKQIINPYSQTAQCTFTARFNFLKKHIDTPLPTDTCTDYLEWKKSLNAESVSLIFSSSYPNTPASLFGHTFLKLNSKKIESKKIEILDYGINFAAATRDDPGIAYALNGLFGGYQGVFSIAPYYTKLNEYLYAESRDVWEYDLNLNSEQVDLLVSHLWEVFHGSFFDYYYLDENCSFQILSLLEVANPDWKLTNFYSYVLPLQTIKRVVHYNPNGTVHYRPSLRKILNQRIAVLTSEERSEFKEIIGHKKPLLENTSAKVNDAINSYLFFKNQSSKSSATDADKKLFRESLILRSKSHASDTFELPKEDIENHRPDKGHNPYRLGAALGYASNQSFEDLNFRFGVHDLLSPEYGYIRFSSIEIANLQLRFLNSDQKFSFQNFDLFKAYSLFPKTMIEHPLSWKLSVRINNPRDLNCINCEALSLNGGLGYSWNLFNDHDLFYFLAIANFTGSSTLGGLRGGPGAEAGLVFNPFDRLKTSFKYELAADYLKTSSKLDYYKVRHIFENQWVYFLSENFDLRLRLLMQGPNIKTDLFTDRYATESSLSINYYY